VVALLGVRNESLYLARCLDHLHAQGVETCVIDNDSRDGTREIAESYRDRGVFRIEHVPYAGYYPWERILALKERLAGEIPADWVIHHDADEIRESPWPGVTLAEALARVGQAGWDAVEFDEFVFFPTTADADHEGQDYVRTMTHYRFFRPGPRHRVNAWRPARGVGVGLVESGGHRVDFPGMRLCPQRFVLRHYIALSRDHVVRKYGTRVYSPEELARGWHRKRAAFRSEAFRLPHPEQMLRLTPGGVLDTSRPMRTMELLEPCPGA
jgi:hypothetical protein